MKLSLLIAASLLLAMPSTVSAQPSDEEIFAVNLGMTAGTFSTACIMLREGWISRDLVKNYGIGYMESVRKDFTGHSLAGSLKGLEISKENHPNCPIPE